MSSTNETPTFMDRFALHLAKELVGPKTVLQVLNEHMESDNSNNNNKDSSTSSKRRLLYWRSELFLNDPADMIDAAQWPCAKDHGKHLMYLDAKFEFCIKPKKEVQTTWGCFVLHSHSKDDDNDETMKKYKNYGMYYKSKPMTLQCLEKHVESMDIDLHEMPQNMAKFMRPALVTTTTTANSNNNNNNNNKKGKNVVPNSKGGYHYNIQLKDSKNLFKKNSNDDDKKTIQLELYYKELDDKGILTLEMQDDASSSSPYNEMGLEPIYLRELLLLLDNRNESSPQNGSSNHSKVLGTTSPPPFGNTNNNSPIMNSPTTPISPAARKEKESVVAVDSQLDQVLEEWFRHVFVDPTTLITKEQQEEENKKPGAAAVVSSPPPGPIMNNNNANKKKRPAKNPQNHGMIRVKKKKKKGGLFG